MCGNQENERLRACEEAGAAGVSSRVPKKVYVEKVPKERSPSPTPTSVLDTGTSEGDVFRPRPQRLTRLSPPPLSEGGQDVVVPAGAAPRPSSEPREDLYTGHRRGTGEARYEDAGSGGGRDDAAVRWGGGGGAGLCARDAAWFRNL